MAVGSSERKIDELEHKPDVEHGLELVRRLLDMVRELQERVERLERERHRARRRAR